MSIAFRLIFLGLLIIFINGCAVNKDKVEDSVVPKFKLNTLRNNKFTVKYPSNWERFGAHGYLYFTPKQIRKENYNVEINHISINKNLIPSDTPENPEKTITNYAESLKFFEISKSYKVVKLDGKTNFIYKIEYTTEIKRDTFLTKGVEYFFKTKDNLQFIRFQMREELFDTYINEAMIIINSFKHKKQIN